jgi:uncharacterized membrane protein required for colicin V production
MAAVLGLGQDPAPAVGLADPSVWEQLQHVGWVDRTAFAVLLVFFVLGLFKGLIWQVSRVGILLAAYVLSGRYGRQLGDWLAASAEGVPPPADPSHGIGAVEADALRALETPETTLYLAYVAIFLAVLIVLSVAAILLQKLARKAGLGFFDRLGGGLIGLATGACVVLFAVGVVQMFFRDSQLALAAESSHSLRLSQRALDSLGPRVPDELRAVYRLEPLAGPGEPVEAVDKPGRGVPVEADDGRR